MPESLLEAALGTSSDMLRGCLYDADAGLKIAAGASQAVRELIDGPWSVRARLSTTVTPRLDIEATTQQATRRAAGSSPQRHGAKAR